jgi:hypothetical protein
MLPEATLFGVALVMIIVASLAFLLIRKPSFSFGGISTETTKLKTKSRKSKEETKKVSETCPKYLGYLKEIPKNTRIPNECLTCTKMMECQGLDAFRREEASEKTTQMTQTLRDSKKPSEPIEPQKIIEKRQVPTAPQKQPQERPSGCQHFFGYLRNIPKNTLIPDECLTCTKMVECQELNAFRREEASEKTTQMTQTLRDSEKPSEPIEPQKIIEKRQVPTAPQKQPQERPSGCQHFFGYLRNMPKNTLIPDECLGCSKMVECLYHTILE